MADIIEDIAAQEDDVGSTDSGTAGYGFNSLATHVSAWKPAGTYTSRGRLGLRFTGIAIPAGATIDLANLKTVLNATTGAPDPIIFGDDVDDADQWSAPGNLPRAITKTTASVAADTSGTSGDTKSHNVTTIIAEIVARAGWASGNNIRLIAEAVDGGVGTWNVRAYEFGTPGTDQAILEIDYTEAAPPPAPSAGDDEEENFPVYMRYFHPDQRRRR